MLGLIDLACFLKLLLSRSALRRRHLIFDCQSSYLVSVRFIRLLMFVAGVISSLFHTVLMIVTLDVLSGSLSIKDGVILFFLIVDIEDKFVLDIHF